MSKIYKFQEGLIGDYSHENDTSFINHYKLVTGVSTYKGGTTDYMNYIVINMFKFKPHMSWHSKKNNTGYPL